jgi:hypothetical protein
MLDAGTDVSSASIVVEGMFIDYPIACKARRIVRLADAIARHTKRLT